VVWFSLFAFVLLAPVATALGDDSVLHQAAFPTGVSVEYGFGSLSMRDEYISKEKYTGALPQMGISWSRSHETYLYHLSLDYHSSSEISNYNVSTDVYQFTLRQSFLYPLSQTSLFSRDLFVFLGPSTSAHVFYNNPQIAVSGFDYAQSFAVLLSLGLHTDLILPMGHGVQAEGGLQFSALSLGIRMVDDEEEDVSPVKPLTVFSGTDLKLLVGARYRLTSGFSLKASYGLFVTRISSWEPLLTVSDNLIMTLTYGF
jgi:hypothetical protein